MSATREVPAEEKLSQQQEHAISALLSEATIKDAATKLGISERTVRRWLKEPAFAEVFRAARRASMSVAIAAAQVACTDAVVSLRQITKDRKAHPSSRVSAARVILETAIKTTEIEDIQERLDALERATKEDVAASESTQERKRKKQ